MPLEAQDTTDEGCHGASQDHQVAGAQRVVRVAYSMLRSHGKQDQPKHDREVAKREEVARHVGPLRTSSHAELPFGNLRHEGEIGPPERAGDGHRRDKPKRDHRFKRDGRSRRPDGHHDLAERDDHEQGVSLGKVNRVDGPFAGALATPAGRGHRTPDLKDGHRRPHAHAWAALEQ